MAHIYRQLFSQGASPELCQALYTTPVHQEALHSALAANSDAIANGSKYDSHPNLDPLREILLAGINLLQLASSQSQSRPLEDEEEDITSLGRPDHNGTAPRHSRAFSIDDKDDIASMTQDTPIISLSKMRLDSVSENGTKDSDSQDHTELNSKIFGNGPEDWKEEALDLGSVAASRRGSTVEPLSPFANIDDDLRNELLVNIYLILLIFFQSLHGTNSRSITRFRKTGTAFRKYDIVSLVFQNPGQEGLVNDLTIVDLLTTLKNTFDGIIDEISSADSDKEFKGLAVLKETIFLLSDILKTVFGSIYHHHGESLNELAISKSLLYAFFRVDVFSSLKRLIKLSNPQFDPVNEAYVAPKVILSLELLVRVYSIIGTLANCPLRLLPNSLSLDITNLEKELVNTFELAIRDELVDNMTYRQEFELAFLPVFASDFNYFYRYREDLLVQQIQNSSFFTWLAGNRFSDNLYVQYHTFEEVTDLLANYNNLSLTQNPKDIFLKDVHDVYERRVRQFNIESNMSPDAEVNLNLAELLPLTLSIYSYSTNETFLPRFTRQVNEVRLKIEDVDIAQDKKIELFEVWLCLLSYLVQYQYKLKYIEGTVKLSLVILLRITSPSSNEGLSAIDNAAHFQINEFKWKLSHQKAPIVPNSSGNYGYKSSLLYILDIVQNLLRFNLTKKLDIENYRLGVAVVHQVLEKLIHEKKNSDLQSQMVVYPWNELSNTLIQLVRFIHNQDLAHFRYFQDRQAQVYALIEEIFVTVNMLLQFKSLSRENTNMLYDLVYALLLNYELVKKLLSETKNLNELENCLQFFEARLHMTEESREASKKAPTDSNLLSKIDMLELDFDNPVLEAMIKEYIETGLLDHSAHEYKHDDTFKVGKLKDETMLKVFTDLFAVRF